MAKVSDFLWELQTARLKDGRTQKELAIACGCTQAEISRILNGHIKNIHGSAYKLFEELKLDFPASTHFDFEAHLLRLEISADARQKELIGIIRHAYLRLMKPVGCKDLKRRQRVRR